RGSLLPLEDFIRKAAPIVGKKASAYVYCSFRRKDGAKNRDSVQVGISQGEPHLGYDLGNAGNLENTSEKRKDLFRSLITLADLPLALDPDMAGAVLRHTG